MSLNSLNKKNNYKLFIGEIDIGEINVDKIDVTSEISTPIINTNTISPLTPGTIAITSNITAPSSTITTISSTTTTANTLNSVNLRATSSVATAALRTITGSGSITIENPLIFFNYTGGLGTNQLKYFDSVTGTLSVTGCVSSTVNYKAMRIGYQVTLMISCFQSVNATSSAIMTVNSIPIQYRPTGNTVRGICQVQSSTGGKSGSYQILTSGNMNIYAGTNGDTFTSGQLCGLFGLSGEFATFTYLTTL